MGSVKNNIVIEATEIDLTSVVNDVCVAAETACPGIEFSADVTAYLSEDGRPILVITPVPKDPSGSSLVM